MKVKNSGCFMQALGADFVKRYKLLTVHVFLEAFLERIENKILEFFFKVDRISFLRGSQKSEEIKVTNLAFGETQDGTNLNF